MFIPTRPPANLHALMMQANSIMNAEPRHDGEVLRHGPSLPALQAPPLSNGPDSDSQVWTEVLPD